MDSPAADYLRAPRGMLPDDADLSNIAARIRCPSSISVFTPASTRRPTTLSTLELTLINILPASSAILSHLSPVHLVLLAASSHTLWTTIYSHPYLWRFFNLRIHTRQTLQQHPNTQIATSGRLAVCKLPGQILHSFSLAIQELQEYRLPWSVRKHDAVNSSYGFRADDPPGKGTPGGVAALLLSRLTTSHAYPQYMVVENYWLANTSITASLQRFVADGMLKSLEVNLLMERDLVEMYRRDFSMARPGTLMRSFAILRTFLEVAMPVGLETLIVTGSENYLIPLMYTHKLFHKEVVQAADILAIIDWCTTYNTKCNMARCACSNPEDERLVREVYAELQHNDLYPRPTEFKYPTFGFRETRACDACGKSEVEALCVNCVGQRECQTCKTYKCKSCFDEFISCMEDTVESRRNHRDIKGEGGHEYDIDGSLHPHTARPFAADRGGPVQCPVCHIPKAAHIERKVCGRCGKLVGGASFSHVHADECACGEILCSSCIYITSELAQRECLDCAQGQCIAGHEFLQCSGCCERKICPECLRAPGISAPGLRLAACDECEQWFCEDCEDLTSLYSESSSHPAGEANICHHCKRKTDWYISPDTLDLGVLGATQHQDILSKGRADDDEESEMGSSEGSQWGVGEHDWVNDLVLFEG